MPKGGSKRSPGPERVQKSVGEIPVDPAHAFQLIALDDRTLSAWRAAMEAGPVVTAQRMAELAAARRRQLAAKKGKGERR
ncbi:MAG: hypothetical protein RBT71_12285 [Flavobacteriales bacterium]|nr:hypothetical protein [Flavobacteriales bacterium]